jgi:hypothetical protein
MKPSLTIWCQASAAVFMASDFQALGSRLSMFSATSMPPNLIAVAITGQLMYRGCLPAYVHGAMPAALIVRHSAMWSSQVFGYCQPRSVKSLLEYQMPYVV